MGWSFVRDHHPLILAAGRFLLAKLLVDVDVRAKARGVGPLRAGLAHFVGNCRVARNRPKHLSRRVGG